MVAMTSKCLLALVSPLCLALASCGHAASGEKPAPAPSTDRPFTVEQVAQFDSPWAMAIDPGTQTIFVTEKYGTIRFRRPDGRIGTVSGVPKVDATNQGGLADFAFAPGQDSKVLDRREVYLSWVEPEKRGKRHGVLGKATLVCAQPLSCSLQGLRIIWQQPWVTGAGQYALRIAFSPDAKYLFVSSGERQHKTPAQDNSNNLGTIVRLLPDGSAAPGNPFADMGGESAQIWSYGHRNPLGLAFDDRGRLWELEHGPRGGDELNLIKPGGNYGWPLVSDGINYDGSPIPDNATRPDLARPALVWTPVIAPGDMIFYSGSRYPGWHGELLAVGLATQSLVRIAIDGEQAHEVARYAFDNRMREIRQAADGTLWLLEDGPAPDSGHLLHLMPTKP